MIDEVPGFMHVYRSITSDVATRGNLVRDPHLAAVLLQNGVVRLDTRDRDFRKFAALKVIDPLA